MQIFSHVSTAMVKEAKNLIKKKLYILSVQKEKTGRPISDELKQAL